MSESNKFTPGPWTNMPRMECVPICGQHDVGLSIGFINSSNPDRMSEGKANAYLIAAAPDLLDALEGMIFAAAAVAVPHDGERKALQMGVDHALKALDKARGQQ